jgi:hypothetical protein
LGLSEILLESFIISPKSVESPNPLIMSTKKQLFMHAVEYLTEQELPIEFEIRLNWIKVKYNKLTKNVKNVLDHLLNTFELFSKSNLQHVDLVNYLSDNIVSMDKLLVKIQYQKVKFKIEECFGLEGQEKQVYDRLRGYFFKENVEEQVLDEDYNEEILKEMSHVKQIKLLDMLRKVFYV